MTIEPPRFSRGPRNSAYQRATVLWLLLLGQEGSSGSTEVRCDSLPGGTRGPDRANSSKGKLELFELYESPDAGIQNEQAALKQQVLVEGRAGWFVSLDQRIASPQLVPVDTGARHSFQWRQEARLLDILSQTKSDYGSELSTVTLPWLVSFNSVWPKCQNRLLTELPDWVEINFWICSCWRWFRVWCCLICWWWISHRS